MRGRSRARTTDPEAAQLVEPAAVTGRPAVAEAPRLVWLDGLRGLAALSVFIQHVQFPGLEDETIGFDVGVMVFFALSGYLLYAPIAAGRGHRPFDLRGYAIKRLTRIFPGYIAAVAGVGLLTGWQAPADPVGLVTLSATPIVVVWTLQIELVFYAVLPLLGWVLGRFGLRQRLRLLGVLGVVAIGIGAVELAVTLQLPISFPPLAFAFVPGMVVAELQASRRDLLQRSAGNRWLVTGAALILASAVIQMAYPDLPAAAGSGILIAHLVTRDPPSRRAARVASAMGAMSYSFYLWHFAVISIVDRPASWLGALAAAALTMAIAAVAYAAVERPFIALGRRLARSLSWQASITRSVQDVPATPTRRRRIGGRTTGRIRRSTDLLRRGTPRRVAAWAGRPLASLRRRS